MRTLVISFITVAVFFTAIEDTIMYLASSDDTKTELTKESEQKEKRESESEKEIDEKIEICNEINIYKFSEIANYHKSNNQNHLNFLSSCCTSVITPPPKRFTLI